MYITYDRFQYNVNEKGRLIEGKRLMRYDRFDEPPRFKPEYLVRVRDMKRVRGRNVHGHYCCLSYCLSQSGEIKELAIGKYKRVDRHRHTIIDYDLVPGSKKLDPKTERRFLCSFERLIQEICSDHDIKYIWYDQMCITDAIKLQEMQRMGTIFRNALYTVILVPELTRHLFRDFRWAQETVSTSQFRQLQETFEYCRRVWTVVEAYHSPTALFVGRDIHFSTAQIETKAKANSDMTPIRLFLNNFGGANYPRNHPRWTARQALGYLANCACRNPYDKIFALATIFPEIKKKIKYSYQQDLGALEAKFYRNLARRDPTILFFGNFDMETTGEVQEYREAQAARLPTWVGVKGAHALVFEIRCLRLGALEYWFKKNRLHIRSTFARVRIRDEKDLDTADSTPLRAITYATKAVQLTLLQGFLTFVRMPSKPPPQYKALLVNQIGTMPTHLLPVVKTKTTYRNTLKEAVHYAAALTLTEEDAECFILTGLLFDRADHATCVKKSEGRGVGLQDGEYLPHNLEHAYPVFAKGKEDRDYRAVGLAYFYPSVKLNKAERTDTIRVK